LFAEGQIFVVGRYENDKKYHGRHSQSGVPYHCAHDYVVRVNSRVDIRTGFQILFLVTLFVFLPFIMVAFAGILLLSYRREARSHKWLVRLAVLAAASSWILLIVVLIMQT
jgi:hypothetical protein